MSSADVSIKLTHSRDEDGEYGAFENVDVDILLEGIKIGSIAATLVNRQRIPDRYFMSAMDGHSSDLQWIGTILFEPRYGRTKLQSLVAYDDPEFLFMYIRSFHVDAEYRSAGSSDVGATALRQLLHHPYIKGNHAVSGAWKVSSVIYVLDSLEAMTLEEETCFKNYQEGIQHFVEPTPEKKQEERDWGERLDTIARVDANQFLRNRFFQDPAIARHGGSDARILVASFANWEQPLQSHAQVAGIDFCVPPTMSADPTGKDAELLKLVKSVATRSSYETVSSQEWDTHRSDARLLHAAGASVLRSHALHAACALNAFEAVEFLLQMEPTAVNAIDQLNFTPLMCAALSAAGRSTKSGIQDVRVIDRLLACEARKDIQDPNGMTAYGLFKKKMADQDIMMRSIMGQATRSEPPCATTQALERKLMPPGGPTSADLSGGEGANAGFADYSQEDGEFESDDDSRDY